MACRANIGDMRRWTLVGLVFGLVLFVFGFGALGMGHGTFLPMAVYGAPISAVPFAGMLGGPIWWTALGWAISARRRKLAIAMLLFNVAGAGVFVLLGTPMERLDDQWRYFGRAERVLPFWVWGGFACYVAMLLLMFRVSLSQSVSSPSGSTRSKKL